MSKFWKLSLLLHLLILNGILLAQDRTCIDFEQHIEPGTYGTASGHAPGSTLFRDQDVAVKLQKFQYSDTSVDFINAVISDQEIFNGDESELLNHNYVFVGNINLQFDFHEWQGRVQQVCINFIDGGGVENLSVNGSPIRVLQNFVGLNGQEIAPGVTAQVELSHEFDFPAGTLCLTGPIDSLLIGGQEMALDNLCFRTEADHSSDDDTCGIANLRAEVLGCNPDGTFNLRLNFEHSFHPSDSFFVIFRDETIGRFAVSQLPLTLENLHSEAATHLENIHVCFPIPGSQNECCAEVNFLAPDCQHATDSCTLGIIHYENLECITDNRYRVTINFEHGDRSGVFVLRTRGGFSGQFQYGQLPIRIALPRTADSLDVWNIQDARDSTCYNVLRVTLPCISENEDTCVLRNAHYSDLECIDDNRYRVTINFEHPREGKFVLQSWSGFRDTLSYAQLPLRLAIPRANDSIDVLSICDLSRPNCCIQFALNLPCADNTPCALGEVHYSDLECIDDNRYRVTINFEHPREGKFVLQSWSGFRDTLSYAQLPLRLAIPRVNDSIDVLSICDLSRPNCCTQLALNLPCIDSTNNACNIRSLTAVPTNCVDGKIKLNISFRAQNTGAYGYLVFVDGQIFGPYRYTQTSIQVGSFVADGVSNYDVLVLDVDDPTCYAYVEVPPVRCAQEDSCSIYDLVARVLPCDSIGRFYVQLKFQSEHTGSGGFSVRGNGSVYGNFQYSQDSVLIGPLEGNGTTHYEFVVQDNENPDCRDAIDIGNVACDQLVWPGDANVNNQADHIDLLNIGLAYGAQGPARQTPGNTWQERRALSWNKTFADGTNYAHADCNGDGVINSRDREAIVQNYGRTHGPIEPVTPLPGTNLDPPIFVDLPNNEELPAGLAFTVPVTLGTANNFVRDLYGLAFTIEFNPHVIDPESIQISYPKSWFGTENVDFITFHQIDTVAGMIHIALTKINQHAVSGFGTIAMISGVIDDIAGIAPSSDVMITGVHAIDLNQHYIPLHTPKQTLLVSSDKAVTVGKLDLQRSLRLLPNPTYDWVQIYTKYQVPIKSVEILDANGKSVRAAALNTDRISLGGLPQGVYILKMQIGDYVINERIVKL